MIGRSSNPHRGPKRAASRRRRSDERGAAIALVVMTLPVLLGSAGLAIDLGRGYLAQVQLARAVDGGALAAARVLRNGEEAARLEAEAVARANGVATGVRGIDTSLAFGTNDRGENTVTFRATRTLPTVFIRIFGIDQMNLAAEAEAAVPPLDIVMVLDVSGSLEQAGWWVWEALQDASRSFVALFSDQIDQIGLVSFQLSAHHDFQMRHNFRIPITHAINNLSPGGDTNIQQGFVLAREQLQSSWARPSAAKVVVFFTDGRATAVRSQFGGQDRILAVFGTNAPGMRGYFNNPNGLPPGLVVYPGSGGNPPGNWPGGGCRNVNSCTRGGHTITPAQTRSLAESEGLSAASQVRADGTLVYVIGLGNPNAADPSLVPDLPYLRRLANQGGIESASQPQGQMYFAPSGAELVQVFEEVAQDLIVRLAR